jgi:hypothetical protein
VNQIETEILAAAIIEVVAISPNITEFKGDVRRVFEGVQRSWPGEYGQDDVIDALQRLAGTHCVVLTINASGKAFARIMPTTFQDYFDNVRPEEARAKYPILFEYSQFGQDWLLETWADNFGSNLPDSSFVDVDPNSAEFREIDSTLQELENKIAHGNEGGDIFGDDKLIVAEEVGQLRQLLAQTRLRISAATERARTTLRWISEKATGAAIGDLAKRALDMIIDWLS